MDLGFVKLNFVDQHDSTCIANRYYMVVSGIFRLMGSEDISSTIGRLWKIWTLRYYKQDS